MNVKHSVDQIDAPPHGRATAILNATAEMSHVRELHEDVVAMLACYKSCECVEQFVLQDGAYVF